MVYTKNCAQWSDIGQVKLPAITFSSVLLSKILSVRVFVWVVSFVGMVILSATEFEYILSREILV